MEKSNRNREKTKMPKRRGSIENHDVFYINTVLQNLYHELQMTFLRCIEKIIFKIYLTLQK